MNLCVVPGLHFRLHVFVLNVEGRRHILVENIAVQGEEVFVHQILRQMEHVKAHNSFLSSLGETLLLFQVQHAL